ncbi:diguanylate cyclase domain-containing protein [Methylomarinum vadi]|uniref:diguanylate cyclase domain-containing protein n=1 Tax=Methylomarinum vadi TaxID=438855 RepID=UPI0004DEF3FB|nr:diguanylate cyclase [Methylomarinum vadi]
MEARNLSPREWADYYRLLEADGKTQLLLMRNPLYQALTGKSVAAFEMMMRLPDESLIALSVNSQPLRDDQNKIVGAVASFQDITSRKKNVNELKKLSLAVQHSPSGIMMTDISGRIEYVNDKFEQINGYTLAEIIGKNPSFLKSGRTSEQTYKELWETLLSGRDWQGEILNQKKNGEYYWSIQFISPVKDEQNKLTHFVCIMEDVTEVRKKSEMISYQASHDDLTGLLNRRECEKRLERVIKGARANNTRHVFCFLDLDKFKIVNDTCGHLAGDDLLRGIAGLLGKQLRQRDTLARLGGDEFGIIMEHCQLKQAREIAEKICLEICSYNFHWQGHCFKIGVSIGLTEVNKLSADFTTVIEQADQACYRVKKQGRGQVALFSDNNIVPF